MSYSIYIGNIEMQPIEDDEYTTKYSRIVNGRLVYYQPVVKKIRLSDAPTFPNDKMTGNSNGRHPSYNGWADFCQEAGLYGLFYASVDGLMKEHPGCSELRSEHVAHIKSALERWEARHPDAVPGFEEFSWSEDVPDEGYDPILARLIWLDFWASWAIEHCEHAGIYNY